MLKLACNVDARIVEEGQDRQWGGFHAHRVLGAWIIEWAAIAIPRS